MALLKPRLAKKKQIAVRGESLNRHIDLLKNTSSTVHYLFFVFIYKQKKLHFFFTITPDVSDRQKIKTKVLILLKFQISTIFLQLEYVSLIQLRYSNIIEPVFLIAVLRFIFESNPDASVVFKVRLFQTVFCP